VCLPVQSPSDMRMCKTSVVFSLREGPGELFKACSVFALRQEPQPPLLWLYWDALARSLLKLPGTTILLPDIWHSPPQSSVAYAEVVHRLTPPPALAALFDILTCAAMLEMSRTTFPLPDL